MIKKHPELFGRKKALWRIQNNLDSMVEDYGENYSNVLYVKIGKHSNGFYGAFLLNLPLMPRKSMTLAEATNTCKTGLRDFSRTGLLTMFGEGESFENQQIIRVKNSNPRWNNYYVCLNKKLVRQFQVLHSLYLFKQKLIGVFK